MSGRRRGGRVGGGPGSIKAQARSPCHQELSLENSGTAGSAVPV